MIFAYNIIVTGEKSKSIFFANMQSEKLTSEYSSFNYLL